MFNLTDFLCKYLRIDTSHPNPDYQSALALFQQQALHDGFEVQQIPLPSGRQVLVVVQRGSDPSLPAIALNHHMDVVPAAEIETWTHAPFTGVCDGEFIYGRGTQDMKGVGVVHYGALARLKQLHGMPRRTIYLLIVPDEEIGGFSGVGQLVATDEFKKLNIGYVLDEGCPSGDDKKLLIGMSERRPLQIKIISMGKMAHGSLLMTHNPLHSLVQVLAKIAAFQEAQKVKAEQTPVGLLLSMNITSLQAGVGTILNVVPNCATATVDIRVPPQMTIRQAENVFAELLHGVSDTTYRVLATAGDYHEPSLEPTPFYKLIEETIEQCGLSAEPFFAEWASDIRFYRQQGIEGFGLTPFTIKDNLHGIDEMVRVSDIEKGCEIMYQLLVKFCIH